MSVKTIAFVINEETYPVAVACFGGGFASIPRKKTFGCVAVLNELEAVVDRRHKYDTPIIKLSNAWLRLKDFNELYKVIDIDSTSMFQEVEAI